MNEHLRKMEFYETPGAFTRWLFRHVLIEGTCLEPCVGSGAIVRDSFGVNPPDVGLPDRQWITNDLDPAWKANHHQDAAHPGFWEADRTDWCVSNPAFTPAIAIIDQALDQVEIGVAMHLRLSIHEPLQTGTRRSFMRLHPPSEILFLPRFAYQRSPKTGKWTTDSMTACWVVWYKSGERQAIHYAPEQVFTELAAETEAYRTRMDFLSGYTGAEGERQLQAKRKAA